MPIRVEPYDAICSYVSDFCRYTNLMFISMNMFFFYESACFGRSKEIIHFGYLVSGKQSCE